MQRLSLSRLFNLAQNCSFVLIITTLLSLALPTDAAGLAHHVVILVMDGLRRDSVTETDMPTLAALSKQGTFFDNHHPVYLSSTEVNGTALATGMTPAHSGVMANREYRPDIELLRPVDTQGQWASWKGDRIGEAPWIRSPTLPELVRGAGLKTAVAGTKPVALMWDRGIRNRSLDQPTVFEGKSIPSSLLDKVLPELGPMPPGIDTRYFPNVGQDRWTTEILTKRLWADGVPALSVLWLSEPDFSQHGSGPGSDNARAGLRSSDDRLATVLAALEERKVRQDTDLFVVSDHGFSTISKKVDVVDLLRKKGFEAGGLFLRAPDKGNIMVVGLGGTICFYVVGHDVDARAKLVSYLQLSDWAGVIFTKEGGEGTFKFSEAGIDSPQAPDVAVSMRWKDETLKGRMPGTIINDGMEVRQGTHGSLSRFDMRNTLIASGPDFKPGFVDKLPSGNSDVAPTIAQILGIIPKDPMDGRVLSEALIDGKAQADAPKTEIIQARRTLGEKTWNQYLRVTTFIGRRYYDEGNTGGPPAESP